MDEVKPCKVGALQGTPETICGPSDSVKRMHTLDWHVSNAFDGERDMLRQQMAYGCRAGEGLEHVDKL